MFFLLFIEAAEGAPNRVIILTALTGVLLLLWVKAKWSGFRPLAARLGAWLDLLYKIAEQHCLKNSPQPDKPKKEYEELPS